MISTRIHTASHWILLSIDVLSSTVHAEDKGPAVHKAPAPDIGPAVDKGSAAVQSEAVLGTAWEEACLAEGNHRSRPSVSS